MKGIVDRIENKFVIVEIKGGYFNFDLDKFPETIKEGDIVEFGKKTFNILEDETKIREKKIKSLFDSLLE